MNAHLGGDLTRMRGANGYSNTTWVGDSIAVRIAHMPVVEQTVNHGDLALMNALWDDGVIVALLDFEFGVLGPVEIDLCRLVWEARVSEEGHRVDSEAGAEGGYLAPLLR